MHVLKILESDVEATNEKTQWITERELERELLQVPAYFFKLPKPNFDFVPFYLLPTVDKRL